METNEGTNDFSQMPELTVIIPTCNAGEYLEGAIDGLRWIREIPHEILIIDDGSTDNTTEVVNNMHHQLHIKMHSLQEHKGQSAARNIGISMAQGRYIAFLDADDLLLDNTLEAIREADTREADILHTPGFFIPADEEHVHFDGVQSVTHVQEFNIEGGNSLLVNDTPLNIIDHFLTNSFLWTPCGKIYRREFLLEHDIRFPEDMNFAESMMFILYCILHAKHYVLFRNVIYCRKDRKTSLSHLKRSSDDLRGLLENEARGLELLEAFFQELPSQKLLPLAKERFCSQMDQVIGPISQSEPGVWGKVVQEGVPILHDPWWFARHLSGWYQSAAERKTSLAVQKQQQETIAATEDLLYRTIKAPRVFLFASVYTMLLCLLYFRDWEKSIFICCGGIPSTIIQKLRELGILCYGKGNGNFINDINILRCIARCAEQKHIPIYGNDDPPEAGQFIQLDFTVVEEGIGNYLPEGAMDRKNAKRIAANGEIFVPFGFNRFVKHVLLTGKQDVPDIMKEKAELIHPQKLWNQKSKKEQEKILEVYSFPQKEVEQQLKKGRDCLLLGVPHATIGLCTEEQEIAMYREIMEPYGQHRFLIKPHHQNRLDLKKHFPDCVILPKEFPVDLMKLLRYKFHRVIGAGCSALFNVFPPDIIEDRIDLMEKHGIKLYETFSEEQE